MSIFVGTLIHADMDAVWRHTQDPALHTRWDVRFSTLRYLPRADRSQPQRFEFTTPIGITGKGEITATCSDANGVRTVSERFDCGWLTRDGWAHWQYVPTAHGVRLLTRFDFVTGPAIASQVVKLPLAYLTAWSFDRLRIWLEQGIPPEQAVQRLLPSARRSTWSVT